MPWRSGARGEAVDELGHISEEREPKIASTAARFVPRLTAMIGIVWSCRRSLATIFAFTYSRPDGLTGGFLLPDTRDRGLTTAVTCAPEGHPANPSVVRPSAEAPVVLCPLAGTGPAPSEYRSLGFPEGET